MVRGSLEHETDHGVYRKRLISGPSCKFVRDEVRSAVLSSLSQAGRTYQDAAEAGALAADHALARVGVQAAMVGTERMGWRGRLAYVLLLIEENDVAKAATELQSLVDEIHPN